MLIICYDASNGDPVSDAWAASQANYLARNISDFDRSDFTYTYSTENIFNSLRLLIATNKLDCEKIRFLFNGETIKVNKYGAIAQWPSGFCDFNIRLSEYILRAALNKKNAEQPKRAYVRKVYYGEKSE